MGDAPTLVCVGDFPDKNLYFQKLFSFSYATPAVWCSRTPCVSFSDTSKSIVSGGQTGGPGPLNI